MSASERNSIHVNTLPIGGWRFTDFPFPPYRFVPGKHPHPTAHPDGHSFHPTGHSEPAVTYYPPHRWRESPDYLYGVDLYNNAFWWEAHEAWEGLWRVTPKESAERRFLQGVIQVAAIHIQLFLGHADGVDRLLHSSREHLEAAQAISDCDHFMGLQISAVISRIADYCTQVRRIDAPPPWHEPVKYPYLNPADAT